MKKTVLVLALSCMCICTWAVPAKQEKRIVTQPNGETLEVYAHGDEYYHWLTDEKGNLVVLQQDGWYRIQEPLTEDEHRTRYENARRKMASRKKTPSAFQQAVPLNIAPRGLIILVSYSDFAFSTDKAEMDSMLCGVNYTRSYTYKSYGQTYRVNANGSARQYFIDQSMGQYQPVFDVVGPYVLSKQQSYYGKNNSDGNDTHADELIIEACRAADADGVDFSLYDNNEDGEIDFVFVIYAGHGEADGGAAYTIWPHFYWIKDGYGYGYPGYYDAVILDGKILNAYACSNEINYTSKLHTGIGTFCHEFSHVLGLPDLYATNSASHRTMSDWDIMDAGSYNGNGDTPPAYSAYERFFCGWLTPTILNSAGTYSFEDLKTSNTAYMITSTGTSNLVGNNPNPTEFFLLENRQRTGWDKPLAGSGMMITKVKYNYQLWSANTVNNTASNMGVDIIEAGGGGNYSSQYDLFPQGDTEYTPYTSYPITSITAQSGVVTFDFMDVTNDIESIDTNPNTLKRLQDGQLIIEKNGVQYNVLGVKVL